MFFRTRDASSPANRPSIASDGIDFFIGATTITIQNN